MSKSASSKLDNTQKDDDVKYLKQPRGPGTGWVFRMPTPRSLIGATNPWDSNRIIGKEIIEGLGTRHLPTARKLRDVMLGDVRKLEYSLSEAARWSLDAALDFHAAAEAANSRATHPEDQDAHYLILDDMLREAEAKGVPRALSEELCLRQTGSTPTLP
jgi:hypothetical protein